MRKEKRKERKTKLERVWNEMEKRKIEFIVKMREFGGKVEKLKTFFLPTKKR